MSASGIWDFTQKNGGYPEGQDCLVRDHFLKVLPVAAADWTALKVQALEQRVEALKAAMKDLRLAAGAKDAELAIIKAEAEAFRRQLIPSAKSTLSADTEV